MCPVRQQFIMPTPSDVTETTLKQRLVLLGLVHATERGEPPANVVQIRRHCADHIDDVAADVLGTPSEVDVARALNELEDGDLISAVQAGEPSPVGKGRPEYELSVPAESVLDEFADDSRLAPLVDRVRDGTW
jgi:hypothetical protein